MDITAAIARTLLALRKLCDNGKAPRRTPMVIHTLNQGLKDRNADVVYAACVTATGVFDDVEDDDSWEYANGAAEWLLKDGYLPSVEDVDTMVRP